MPTQNHIIKKQIFEIDLSPGIENGQNIQSEISDLFHKKLLPLMEVAFNRASSDSRVVTIERLELDLGVLNLGQLAEQLSLKFQETFSRILEEHLFSIQMQQELKNSGISIPTKGDVRAVAISEGEAIARILIFFLRTGQMPWNTPAGLRQMGFSNILLKLFEENRDVAVSMLQGELENRLQLHRFILQNTNRNLSAILTGCVEYQPTVAPERKKSLIALVRFTRIVLEGVQAKKITSTVPYRDLRFRFWKRLTEHILLELQAITPPHSWLRKEIVQMIRTFIGEGKTTESETIASVEMVAGPLLGQLITHLAKSTGEVTPKAEALLRTLIQAINKQQTEERESKQRKTAHQTADGEETPAGECGNSEIPAKNRKQNHPAGQKGKGADTIDDELTNQKGKPEFRKPPLREKMNSDAESGLETDLLFDPDIIKDTPEETVRIIPEFEEPEGGLVQNAGLVILHPFLNTYLGRIGLVEEKKFVSEPARERAVHLLQYLVTGRQETPEEELLLNKLLCGMEPETPIIGGIELTDKEKEESRNLLVNVIEQWSALKKTSPEALRSTFLQRQGLISRDKTFGGWKLNVEGITVDVLLNRLPWGLSIIKMPWNPYLITVEW